MRIDLLLEALPIMGTGYLGIFIVTGVIIGVVSLLTKPPKEDHIQYVFSCYDTKVVVSVTDAIGEPVTYVLSFGKPQSAR